MPLPEQLGIEVASICNIVPPCVMCTRNVDESNGYVLSNGRHFPAEYIDKCAEAISTCVNLSLHGIGEPLTNPNLFKIAAAARPDCWVQFNTNGWLVRPPMVEKILSNHVNLIDFSLDAATAPTYEKIRHGNFNEIVQNISNLLRERNQAGQKTPRVVTNMCLMRENMGELAAFVLLNASLKTDYCYAFRMNIGPTWRVGWFDYAQQHCGIEPDRHDRAIEDAFRHAQQSGVDFKFNGRQSLSSDGPMPMPKFSPLVKAPVVGPSSAVSCRPPAFSEADYATKSPSSNWFCPLPFKQAQVMAHGGVMHCCWQAGYLESIQDKTFEEVWNGERSQEIRSMTLAHKPHPQCVRGLPCPHLEKT